MPRREILPSLLDAIKRVQELGMVDYQSPTIIKDENRRPTQVQFSYGANNGTFCKVYEHVEGEARTGVIEWQDLNPRGLVANEYYWIQPNSFGEGVLGSSNPVAAQYLVDRGGNELWLARGAGRDLWPHEVDAILSHIPRPQGKWTQE